MDAPDSPAGGASKAPAAPARATKPPRRVFLYARKSPANDGADHDPKAQLHRLRTWADKEGWIVVGEGVDEREHGDLPAHDRPTFSHVLDLAEQRPRPFTFLLVSAGDRLSREDPVDALLALRSLYQRGIRVLSPTEPWLDLGADDELGMAMVLRFLSSWSAHMELRRIRARAQNGADARKDTPKAHGRHPHACGIPTDQGCPCCGRPGAGPCRSGAHDATGRSTRLNRTPKRSGGAMRPRAKKAKVVLYPTLLEAADVISPPT